MSHPRKNIAARKRRRRSNERWEQRQLDRSIDRLRVVMSALTFAEMRERLRATEEPTR